jgi:xylulokinase
MTRAVLEGVAFGLRDSLEALRQTGANPERLFLIGGGSASPYWANLLATILGIPLALPEGSEFGAALGAARLGWLATTGGAVEEILTPPKIARVIAPNPALIKDAAQAYTEFRASYPGIKSIAHTVP